MMKYAQLLQRTDAPAGSSWGLFGAGDEFGTANFLTPERVIEAAKLIRRGTAFNLDCHLGAFDPPTSHQRKTVHHVIFGNNAHHRDDYIDGYFLQSGSQIDALRHMRHPIHGFYNGAPDESVTTDDPRNGVSRWAERGLVGRGVLVDMDRHMRRRGVPLDQRAPQPITVAMLEEAAAEQKLAFRPGDILMIRTGWLRHYFDEMTDTERKGFPGNMCSPGLLQSHETLAWLWDHQFAVCAADNPGVEVIPPVADSPFAAETQEAKDLSEFQSRLMHPYLIAMLGLILGELWNLETLAADCEKDGVWEMFVSIKPLNLIGGVGSPANAIALK